MAPRGSESGWLTAKAAARRAAEEEQRKHPLEPIEASECTSDGDAEARAEVEELNAR